MCILSLNCQSINAKFDKWKILINYENDQFPISVILHSGILGSQ